MCFYLLDLHVRLTWNWDNLLEEDNLDLETYLHSLIIFGLGKYRLGYSDLILGLHLRD
jgi:hypothetical protein